MPKSNPKTAARLSASQAYYSMLIDPAQKPESAIKSVFEILDKEKVKVKKKFSEELFNFTVQEKESIEFIIKKYLEKDRTLDKVNPLLLAVLTVAIAELIKDPETARAIIISEYLLIASSFFASNETGFINAILDKFVKEV